MQQKKKKTRRIKAIDLFAGVGGSSWGARAAGINVVAAIDSWPLAKATYNSNFPEVDFFKGKCENVRLGRLKKKIGSANLIIASPECTSHTCAKGKARRSEKSRRTAFQVIRFARAFKPRWLVIENVVYMRRWKSYAEWLEKLKGLGYYVHEQVLNAADFGVPQARRRLFIMCDRLRPPREVEPAAKRKKSAASVLSGNGHFRFSVLRSTNRARATLKRANRAMAAVGNSKPFLIVYYGSDASGGWQRLSSPLRTLTTLDRFAYVRPTSDGHVMRMLQVPEIKRAMGFPKKYSLEHGTRREKIKLLGNAVCPPVMEAVIRAITSPRSVAKRTDRSRM